MKLWRLFLFILISVVLIGSLGCGSQQQKEKGEYLYSVTDAQGTVLNFQEKPHRIVSLSISTDEILLDMLPPEDIIAITKYADDEALSNVVEKAKKIPNRVDGSSGEYILSLHPDLVILPDFMKGEMITSLRDMGLKVYVYKTPSTIEEVADNVQELANLVGEPDKAKPLLDYMDTRLAKVKKVLGNVPADQQLRVALMQDNGVYYSPQSSFRSLCDYAQVYDITKDIKEQHSFNLTLETVVKLNPQAFVLGTWDYDGKHSTQQQMDNILGNKAYAPITAYKEKKFIVIPSNKLLALSPYIADAVVMMAEKAYPEKFKEAK